MTGGLLELKIVRQFVPQFPAVFRRLVRTHVFQAIRSQSRDWTSLYCRLYLCTSQRVAPDFYSMSSHSCKHHLWFLHQLSLRFLQRTTVSYLVHCVKLITQYAHVYASDSEYTPTFGICSAFHLKNSERFSKVHKLNLTTPLQNRSGLLTLCSN